MNAYLLPGVLGLLTGFMLYWTGLCHPTGLSRALSLRRSTELRSSLSAVGYGMLLAALLGWLAVLDVDRIEVLPLTAGTLLGGALLGVCCALCGFTPSTAFAGVGGGSPAISVVPEALSVLLGCLGMTWLLPFLSGFTAPLQGLRYSAATLFRVTLDEPWLLEGGFLGLGCLGLLLVTIAICVPNPRRVQSPVSAEASAPEPSQPAPEEIPDPEEAPADAFIAALEGEEPLVIDTGVTEDAPDDGENQDD